MKKYLSSKIISNQQLSKSFFQMDINCPEIVKISEPGQFVNIYFSGDKKIFPRPFSIAGAKNGILKIVYKVVGSQTLQMSRWKSGHDLKILGPLGNKFSIKTGGTHVLIGGGVGIAPMLFLKDSLVTKNSKPYLLIGARNKDEMFLFEDYESELNLSTDDGSHGFRGNVVSYFQALVDSMEKPLHVYCCGPDKMLEVLAAYCKKMKFDLQVSIEKVMACGMGLCQGCATKTKTESGEIKYSLVCKDGPVYNAGDVFFNG